jgi:hypothetical protein
MFQASAFLIGWSNRAAKNNKYESDWKKFNEITMSVGTTNLTAKSEAVEVLPTPGVPVMRMFGRFL